MKLVIHSIVVIAARQRGWMLAVAAALALQLAMPPNALATQGHGGIEGVYAHQLAHLFFVASMGVLIYWLRARGLVRSSGWRLIQYAALFFIIWNLNAALVHALDDQFRVIQVQRLSPWTLQLSDPFQHNGIKWLYYLAKLDHLLCVPAMVFLYLGLKRLLHEKSNPAEEESPL